MSTDPREVSEDLIDRIPLRLLQILEELGVSPSEIAEAAARDELHLLVVDTMIGAPSLRLTSEEVSAQSGISATDLRRVWRALGFIEPQPGEKVFSPVDIAASRSFSGLLGTRPEELDVAIQLARVIGSSMARVAEAEILSSNGLKDLNRPNRWLSNTEIAERFALYSTAIVPSVPQLLGYVWLRHLHAASRRVLLMRDNSTGADLSEFDLSVGFLDLVGFTVLSQQLTTEELARVVNRFEEVAHNTVTSLGGRLVKMIGDEVMFVCQDPQVAVEIALVLQEEYKGDRDLSEVRAGVATGRVLAKDGDYYGPIVNLASRIVNIATPSSILISEPVADRLRGKFATDVKALQPRFLKDLGYVQLYRVRRGVRVNGAN